MYEVNGKKYDFNSIKNQEIKRKFVEREILHCVSSMVYELSRTPDLFPEYEEELLTAYLNDYDGGNDEYNEVLEHWAVTGWLSEKLAGKMEKVFELFDFTIWGRMTSGQAISLDYVISEICYDMEILEGQKNQW